MSGAEVTFLLLLVWFALDYRIRNLKGAKMTDDDDDTQVYRSELKAAVKAEREACAKVADAEAEESVDCCYSLAVRVSSAIRARGEKK